MTFVTQEGFYSQMRSALPRATAAEWEDIRKELEGHVEDRVEALEEKGISLPEAEEQALAALGDPAEIGAALNAQLSPFWLWAGRIGMIIALMSGYILLHCVGTGVTLALLGDKQVGIAQTVREQLAIRMGQAPAVEIADDARYYWESNQEMQVGDNRIRLVAVELIPISEEMEAYRGRFTFCVYHKDLWRQPGMYVRDQFSVATETEVAEVDGFTWSEDNTDIPWEHSYDVRISERLVVPEDTYIDVSYDHFGIEARMRCPLMWEENG